MNPIATGRSAALLPLLLLAPLVAGAQASRFCAQVGGATLVAQDAQGTVLGHVTDRFDPESVFNEYGRYGSRYSGESVWNSRGTFGSPYSGFSPYNDNTTTPPVLMKGGQIIGVLTTNARLPSAVSPDVLRSLCAAETLPRSKAGAYALATPLEPPAAIGDAGRESASGRPTTPQRADADAAGVPACVRVCTSVPTPQFAACLERCEGAGAASPAGDRSGTSSARPSSTRVPASRPPSGTR
jgi:hypothetical protein